MRRLNPALVLPALAGFTLLLTALGSGLVEHAAAQAPGPQPNTAGPIKQENKKPGSRAWQSAELSRGRGGAVDEEQGHGANAHPHAAMQPAATANATANAAPVWTDSVIRGYADQTSINHGQSIRFMVSTAKPRYDIEVYRMGWYGGDGSTLVTTARGLTGQNQPVPTPDATTGLIAANWQPSYTLQSGAGWTSGVYLAKLIASSGDVGYIVFVVRADEQQADIVYQLPVNTYSAYNNWGGKSLYDFNSTNSQPAYKVSFDRPYADWDGAGDFFDGDYNMIRWLEKQGYNITYTSSVDTQTSPSLLSGRKVFLSPWHDEYWSKPMRDTVTAARDRGMNLAFFDANAVYWQVRFEPSAAGAANRVITCYKDASLDPMAKTNPPLTTVQWRQAPVNQPENALLGAMYESYWTYGKSFPWVVQNSSSWVYAGTGLKDGDSITGLVGYEYDRVWNNGFTPPGEVVLSNSPVTDLNNVASHQNGVTYVAPSGAIVFDAGTVYWSWKLDDNDYQSHGADSRVQTMTANILNKMTGSVPIPPTPTPPPTSVSIYGDALASGWVNWSWTASVNFANTSPVAAGTKSIAFKTTKAYGGLYLHTDKALSLTPYTTLSFQAQAANAGEKYSVILEDVNDKQVGKQVFLANAGGDPVVGSWKSYQIPLATLGATGKAIGGIVIEDEAGKAQVTVYLDEIGFK